MAGEGANIYTPKLNKSWKCCREDEHQGCAVEEVPPAQSKQELLVATRRQRGSASQSPPAMASAGHTADEMG